jgi:cyanate permease
LTFLHFSLAKVLCLSKEVRERQAKENVRKGVLGTAPPVAFASAIFAAAMLDEMAGLKNSLGEI